MYFTFIFVSVQPTKSTYVLLKLCEIKIFFLFTIHLRTASCITYMECICWCIYRLRFKYATHLIPNKLKIATLIYLISLTFFFVVLLTLQFNLQSNFEQSKRDLGINIFFCVCNTKPVKFVVYWQGKAMVDTTMDDTEPAHTKGDAKQQMM